MCIRDRLYITWFAAAVYVVPLLLLAVIYVRICSVVWRTAASAPPLPSFPSAAAGGASTATAVVVVGQSTPGPGKRPRATAASLPVVHDDRASGAIVAPSAELAAVHSLSKAKTKTVKLTLTVVISFVICWGPFIVAQLWSAWDPDAPFEGNQLPRKAMQELIRR